MVMPQDWLVTNNSDCIAWELEPDLDQDSRSYRLYRLLTDIEDTLAQTEDDQERLRTIVPLVRRLITQSTWLSLIPPSPDPDLGWSVQMLYDEPDFPLTVQLVSWQAGTVSPIHNHGCWGIVALLSGAEKNTLWRRSPDPDHRDRIEPAGECSLRPGDIISFLPDAIHSVAALESASTISLNIYGVTDYDQRFQFDPHTHTAEIF